MKKIRVPAHEIQWLVDRYHVGADDDAVRADLMRRAMAIDGIQPSEVNRVGDVAVRMHHENRDLYARVMSGRLR